MRHLLPRKPSRTESGVEEFPMGPRGVETELVRKAAPWMLVLAPACLVGGWLVAGADGLISAAIGCALGAGNLLLAAVMLERAARVGGQALLMAATGGFVVRLLLLLVAVLLLRMLPFVNVPVLVIVLAITYVGLLVTETLVVTRDDRKRDRARILDRSQFAARDAEIDAEWEAV